MKIELFNVKVREVFDGYSDMDDDGVVGYGGMLDIRPPYQRAFVYKHSQAEEVIHTVIKGFPLNVMYWVNKGDGQYEILDGQQRTLSLMQYLDHQFSITYNGNQYYCDSLPDDCYEKIMNYELMVYVCEGTTSEKLEWFKIVNIAGEPLTNQELRNSVYTGSWLSSAKAYFSKRNCPAKMIADNYTKGDPNRQELLEKALNWIGQSKRITIEEYMTLHQHDSDADELWQYWQDIYSWVNKIFSNYRGIMKGIDWGTLYNTYHNNLYNSIEIENTIKQLLADEEVQNKKGIYEYILSGNPKTLNLRSFDERDKRKKYEEQKCLCPECLKEGNRKIWKYEEMDGDHIIPWSKGGKTEYKNLQMLCKFHNKVLGNRF